MQSKSILNFYAQAEELIISIFRQQGGWRSMAIALTPAGLKMIAIADGADDRDVAKLLREELVASNAWAYAAAYVSLKLSSPAFDRSKARGGQILDAVDAIGERKEVESGPDHALFIFMSDTVDDRVRAYGIRNGKRLTKRIAWLEQSTSPLHRLLISRH
jgi:hypothetical protein